MSTVASRPPVRPELPRDWERLERAAREAVAAVGYWRRRSTEAEDEVVRLRRALEELASERARPGDLEEEVRRLRAENAALRSRMQQARKRLTSLLRRLSSLGIEP